MNVNKIYKIVNEMLNLYASEGVETEHLLNYLNSDSENFNYLYNKTYRKLTLDDIMFESDVLKDVLKDAIRDRIALHNDTASR